MMVIFTIVTGYFMGSNIYEGIQMGKNGKIDLVEVNCKSIENTGFLGRAEYYIFTKDGHRYQVYQGDWDKYDVPRCER
jgi:hypothetical protein